MHAATQGISWHTGGSLPNGPDGSPSGPLFFCVAWLYPRSNRIGTGVRSLPDIQLDYAIPADDLVDYITLFYLFVADVPLFEDRERADHAQLRFRLSPGGQTYRFHDGMTQSPPDIHVIGPTTGPIQSRAPGPVRVFGMGLTPAGWAAMIGSDASAVLNRTLDATALFGAARMHAAAGALAAAPDIAACVAVAEPLLRDLVRQGDIAACGFVRQVDAWLAGAP
jgi:hypothetical protein